jgi:hypothetical protein
MNLIERYIHEVGTNLPAKLRSDIEAELQSSILDMLEEKRRAGQTVTDATTLQVLKEIGNPTKVAASYRPPDYLIGPELYPIFIKALKIGMFILSLVALVVLGVRIAVGDLTSWEQLLESIGMYFNWLILVLGYVVVTFAILQRISPALKAVSRVGEKEWDPAELLKKPDADKIPLSSPVIAVIFTLVALVVFNVFPHVVAIGFVEDGKWVILASLSDAFFRLMPFINAMWVLLIAFHVVRAYHGRWRTATRWAFVALQLFGIAIIATLLAGPDVIKVNLDVLNAVNTSSVSSETLSNSLNLIARASLGIAIAVSCIEVGRAVYRIFSRK